jgi:hypothetical protein
MAKLGIGTGIVPDDGTGDSLLDGAVKINSNFDDIYTYFGDGVNLTAIGGTWVTTAAGIHTLKNVGIGTTNPRFLLEVGAVGASGTTLFVNGDARVTGIVTIGPASITLNGIANIINVGTGITINGSTGTINASSIVLGGSTLTGAGVTSITAGSGISVNQSTGNVTITATGGGGSSQWVTTAAGIHTLSNVGIGTTNPTSALTVTGNGIFTGVVTATTFIGSLTGTATSTTNIPNLVGDIVSIGNNTSLGSITSTALRTALTSSTGTGDAVFATSPTFATPALGTPASGTLTNCTFPTLNQNTTGTSGGLTGTPNITVGVATASTLNVGTAGTIITTITAGLVGIGTTNPIEKLTVVGVTSSTSFYGDASYTVSGRWTLGADGTSNYTFVGIGFTQTTNDPVLYLARGRVYEFVNNSGGSHPFEIRVSNGGAAYSDGVTNNAAATGVIRFEIPFNAPNTLYYQCTVHSGMGNTISVYPTTI